MPYYRAAIIGCGRMAHAHARGYLAQPDVTLVACADPLLEARQRFAAEFTIPRAYSSLEELLEADAPDILSICTPHPLHAPLTIAAAQAGVRAILCEKPIALTLPDADAMIAACAQSHTLLIIGHQRRFSPQYIAARSVVASGQLGAITTIYAHGHPGSSLLVDGTHTIDLLRFFLDEIPARWVLGQIDDSAQRHGWGHPTETAALAWIGFANDVRTLLTEGGIRQDAHIIGLEPHVTGPHYHHITIRGEHADLLILGDHVEEGTSPVSISSSGQIKPVPLPWPLEGDASHFPPVAEEIRLMLRCLETGAPHPLNASSARATLEILLAIYESSRRRATIQLPLTITDNPLFAMRAASASSLT